MEKPPVRSATEHGKPGRVLLLGVLTGVVVLAAGTFVFRDPQYRAVRVLNAVYSLIDARAVQSPDSDSLLVAAADGMMSTLDPYCEFLSPSRREVFREATEGLYCGIGIEMVIYDGKITVVSPIQGSPADQAGVRAGDRIITIDKEPAVGITTGEAMRRLRGPRGTKIEIGVERPGMDYALTFELVRDEIVVRPIPFAGLSPDSIGYVRLIRFLPGAAEMLDSILQDFLARGARTWILDLRGNPGGLLDQAIDVAGCFLPRGALVCETRGRSRFAGSSLYTASVPVSVTVPLVVLIDGGSASASEIVAAAIADHHRGVIVGRRSFGKGLVQSQGMLDGDYGLQLTTARYYTPGGYTFFHPWRSEGEDTTAMDRPDDEPGGLRPHVEVPAQGLFVAEVELMRRGEYLNLVAAAGSGDRGISFDDLWRGFHDSLAVRGPELSTPVTLAVARAESAAASSPLAAEWRAAFSRWGVPIAADRAAELARAMPRLKLRLAEALVLYGGKSGRFLTDYLALDNDTRRAAEILKDLGRYRELLAAPATSDTGRPGL